MEQGKRYAVFSIKGGRDGKDSIWTRAGSAWVNRDGSLNLFLDVLPIEGRLHVREALPKLDERAPTAGQSYAPAPAPMAAKIAVNEMDDDDADAASMGGH